MSGIAMRGVSRHQQIALLGAGWHAGGRSDALHVKDHRWNLGVVRQTNELIHQRQSWTTGRCEGTRTIPRSAHHHTDGGQLIFGLNNGVVAFTGGGVNTQLLTKTLERIHQGS